MDNPYIKIVETIKNQNSVPNYTTGKVTSLNPLKVSINNNEFDNKDILVNSLLIHQNTYYLDIGDKVVILISHDMQELILLCKVV